MVQLVPVAFESLTAGTEEAGVLDATRGALLFSLVFGLGVLVADRGGPPLGLRSVIQGAVAGALLWFAEWIFWAVAPQGLSDLVRPLAEWIHLGLTAVAGVVAARLLAEARPR